jgi:hypothetical protein
VRRIFRGIRYTIEVRNPGGAECGVSAVTVDGVPACESQPARGKVLPLFAPGTEHHAVVTLG